MQQALLIGFLKKIIFRGKEAIFGLKMACPHHFCSSVRIFLKFCQLKGTERYMENVLMAFVKKFPIRANGRYDQMAK